jgi:heme-degrading monooxygenase HmoA
MFTRVVEIKTKRGKAKRLCHAIHQKMLSIFKAQQGFVDEIVLISETDADHVLALSFWKTRSDAERYSRKHYAAVRKLIQHQVHTAPRVRAFNVETSITHRIARGKAAQRKTRHR